MIPGPHGPELCVVSSTEDVFEEAEVAGLVAEGFGNKQIGARLCVSERTVDGQIRNMLNKLGFTSRTQIAGWIASSNR